MIALEAIDAEIKYLTECGIVRGLAPFEQKRLDNLTASRAAVAELIEAQKEYFAAVDEGNDEKEYRAELRLRAALAKASP